MENRLKHSIGVKRLGVVGSLLAATMVLSASCAGWQSYVYTGSTGQSAMLRPPPPDVRVAEVRLASHPTNQQLGLYYCQQGMSRSPLGPMGALACNIFGAVPTREQLAFNFDVELEIRNTSNVPMPLVQAMVAFKAFPEHAQAAATTPQGQTTAGSENLGAVCVSLCQNETSCPQDASACQSTEPEIRDMNDFAMASANFLVAAALGQRRFEDLRIRTVDPGQNLRFVVRLSLDIDQMLRLIERMISGGVQSAQRGQMPNFVIPFEVEGSIWVTVENFGRFAATFPAVRSQWDMGQTAAQAVQGQPFAAAATALTSQGTTGATSGGSTGASGTTAPPRPISTAPSTSTASGGSSASTGSTDAGLPPIRPITPR